MIVIASIIIGLILVGVIAYFVMSKRSKIQFFANAGTYGMSKNICEKNGLELCSIKDICPDGPLKNPIMGMSSSDEWIPVKDSEGDYVSVGNYDPKVRLCRTHADSLKQKPSWAYAIGAWGFRRRVACCPIKK